MASPTKHVEVMAPPNGEGVPSVVFVYDRRHGCDPEVRVPTCGVSNLTEFAALLRQVGPAFFVVLEGRLCPDHLL